MKYVECSQKHKKMRIAGRDENELLLHVEEHNTAFHPGVDKQTRSQILPYVKDDPEPDTTALLSPDYEALPEVEEEEEAPQPKKRTTVKRVVKKAVAKKTVTKRKK